MLFADLAGFTALTEAHGDDSAVDAAERFCAMVKAALGPDDRLVKTIGDAAFVVTATPRAGLDVAFEVLRSVAAEPNFPGVRAGLHVGEVIERDGDVYGATVNVAARLTELAHVGQLVTTASVVEHVTEHDGATTRDLGSIRLKHVSKPFALYAVDLDDHEPEAQVLDPVCRMYIDADDAPARLPWGGRTWMFCSLECAARFASDPDSYVD